MDLAMSSQSPDDKVPAQSNGGVHRSRGSLRIFQIAAGFVVAVNIIVALAPIGKNQSPLSDGWLLPLSLTLVWLGVLSRDFQLGGRRWERTILTLIIVSGLAYLTGAVIKGW